MSALPAPALFARRLDLPLAHDSTGRFLSGVVGIMIYLAIVMTAGALALASLAQRWEKGASGTVTVQVMPMAEGAPSLVQRLDTALALLRATPGVESAEPMAADAVLRLLEPWLGEGALAPDLPVPALVDVRLSGEPALDLEGLKRHLAATVAGVSLDGHGSWMTQLLRLARLVQGLAFTFVALILAAGLLVVVATVRAGLAIHRDVVELLHLMGAADAYIAGQFESHVLTLALRGGLPGTFLAFLSLAGVGMALGSGEGFSALLPELGLAGWQWAALLAVPLAMIGLATLTARIAVMRVLAIMV